MTYEIDLSTKNATKLRGRPQQWVAGRRVGGRRRGRSGSGRGRGAIDREQSAAIREDRLIATAHGHNVSTEPDPGRRHRRRGDLTFGYRRPGAGRRYFAAFAGGEPMAARRRKR